MRWWVLPTAAAAYQGTVRVLLPSHDGTATTEQKISLAAGGLVGLLANSDYLGIFDAPIADLTDDRALDA